jgi:hypothetical protein
MHEEGLLRHGEWLNATLFLHELVDHHLLHQCFDDTRYGSRRTIQLILDQLKELCLGERERIMRARLQSTRLLEDLHHLHHRHHHL